MPVRPLNDWVVVRCEPIRTERNGLILVHGERVRFGEVIAVGPGRKYRDKKYITKPAVRPGERVAFYRETLETQSGKQIARVVQELGNDLGMIRATDILFVIAPGVEVEVQ